MGISVYKPTMNMGDGLITKQLYLTKKFVCKCENYHKFMYF